VAWARRSGSSSKASTTSPLFERAADVGGVWRDNSYPGCACDVQSDLYSFSFAPNPRWTRRYAPQAEIHAYLRDCAQRFGIVPHVRFGHELMEAAWDEAAQRWRLTTSRGVFTADLLVTGAGALSDPSIPRLPGLERFEGKTFHSARWDHGYDLAGKKVAVIGTGASAVQFVPRIQERVARLHTSSSARRRGCCPASIARSGCRGRASSLRRRGCCSSPLGSCSRWRSCTPRSLRSCAGWRCSSSRTA
jgi:cation diffusion facilitator CzcD-associated flavoprotein CzcO